MSIAYSASVRPSYPMLLSHRQYDRVARRANYSRAKASLITVETTRNREINYLDVFFA